jgi:hypothetical protein
MSEIKLQSDIARKHSELFPLKRGQLFHVSNERNNKVQAFQARSIGIFPGVSDFIFFERIYVDWGDATIIVGIEIKEPGSRHERSHIEQQVEWAEILEAQGGIWRLCTNVEDAISCTKLMYRGLTIADVKEMLKIQKTKTIKF